MLAIACSTLTLWACVLLTMPSRPLLNNEVEETVYARLLGRQHRLVFLALLLTGIFGIAVLAHSPPRIDPDLRDLRSAARVCDYPSVGFPTCYRMQPNGTWAQEAFQDGQWVVVGTVVSHPPVFDPYDDPATRNR